MRPLFPPPTRLVLFTGNYGSGKTEVSVNVATALAREGTRAVTIADLDLVNPYFRCREAREPMETLGIRVLAPGDQYHSADLPILLPEVRGAVDRPDGITLLDVGGDNVGATVLAALTGSLRRQPHEMHFVLNRNRPFTDTVEGAMRLIDEIERASRLNITHITGNTHLMDETTLEMAREGAAFAVEVAAARGVQVGFVTCAINLLPKQDRDGTGFDPVRGLIEIEGFHGVPVLPLKRIMLPPWLGGPVPGIMATHARDRFSRLS